MSHLKFQLRQALHKLRKEILRQKEKHNIIKRRNGGFVLQQELFQAGQEITNIQERFSLYLHTYVKAIKEE